METRTFQADTSRLLDLVINSLYTKREVFLRELIANASDALDRYRLESLQRAETRDESPLEIHLEVDPAARTLTVRDNGVGMTRAEVVDDLGTVARSGTKRLVERLRSEGSSLASLDLIGQFGVGFYSSFMVADAVTLTTRTADAVIGTKWESTGTATYDVTECENAPRGTAVTLHLKPADPDNGIEDYCDRWVLAAIVKRHADFVTYPVIYDGPIESIDGAVEEPTAVTRKPLVLNSMKPIWTRVESDVTPEEYTEFYQAVTHEWNPPLCRIAGRADGRWEYAALVFVPEQAPHDLLYHKASYGLQLYSRRMLVAENCQELVPRYLRFLRGVVDAADVPLNVSRQSLQDTRYLTQMRRWLTRKVLNALETLRKDEADKYALFWKQFGRVLKEGPSEDRENQERILPLLFFESSADPARLCSLSEYVARMKPEQNDIFYATGPDRVIVERSPHLEAVLERGYEVLLLTEPVDELLVQAVGEYAGHRLRSVAKGKVEMGSDEERARAEQSLKEDAENFGELLRTIEQHLSAQVRSVRLSRRLTTSPACLASDEHELSPQLDRLLLRGKGAGPKTRRILELNPKHKLVTLMQDRLQVSKDDPLLLVAADVLYGCATLSEGSELTESVAFTKRVTDLLLSRLQGRETGEPSAVAYA